MIENGLTPAPSPTRKGRFLWMDDSQRQTYLADLKHRIADGYFSSELITTQLVDDLAPAMNDSIDREIEFSY